MFDLNKVPLKRKIIACVILALPGIYVALTSTKVNHNSIINELFYCVLYGGGVLLMAVIFGGLIAAALIVLYIVFAFIGRLLLGVKPEEPFETAAGIGVISLILGLIVEYYFAFGGKIPQIIWQ